ncbi:hypothetical protein FJY68_10955, partial [candidate division WOR-3 bacterium]|nr:hypothetical protein [candidate division WOR-3 bacterium]
MNKAATLVLALLLLSGLGWASNTATVVPTSGVRAEAPQNFQTPPMPVGEQDAVLLTQDFSGSWTSTSPPTGWIIGWTGAGPDANDWYNGGGYARLYWYPYDYGQRDTLVSPTVNCAGYTNITLTAYVQYDYFGGGYTAVIEGSTNGGSTWPITIRNYNNSSYTGTEVFNINSWAAGQSQVRIRWRGTGDIYNINWWNVDNVLLQGDMVVSNDIGVSQILAPIDPFYAFGDTLWPRAIVRNWGTAAQNNVPIRCRMRDSVSGTIVYDSIRTVSLAPNQIDTVDFPGWVPSAVDAIYRDTIRAENPGDQNPANDAQFNRVKVTEWGSECLTYNDGTFDNAISWVAAGNQLATRFVGPKKPLPINKAILYISSFSGADYAA